MKTCPRGGRRAPCRQHRSVRIRRAYGGATAEEAWACVVASVTLVLSWEKCNTETRAAMASPFRVCDRTWLPGGRCDPM